jgi:hypothetical protein
MFILNEKQNLWDLLTLVRHSTDGLTIQHVLAVEARHKDTAANLEGSVPHSNTQS